jgi:glycosyltransferase involved in cell wall biosynthesis
LRILFVLNGYFPNSIAGTEMYVSKLSSELVNAGMEVEILIPSIGSSDFLSYYYQGIKINCYPEMSQANRRLILGLSKPSGLTHFKTLLVENKFDVIHFHEIAGSNGITLNHIKISKQICKVILYSFHLSNLTCTNGTLVRYDNTLCNGKISQKYCTSCFYHKQIPNVKVSSLLSILSNFIYKLRINPLTVNSKLTTSISGAHIISNLKKSFKELEEIVSHFVVLTEWYKHVLLLNNVPFCKMTHISQGLTNQTVFNGLGAIYTKGQTLKLIFIGRISHFKGLHLLIDAIEEFNPNLVELTIYGKADSSTYAEKLKTRTRLMVNIKWEGILNNTNIIDVMQKHHLLCLCSTFSEMSPLVLQEAFAAKLPVLASDVVGNNEQIKDSINGYLFKMNDVRSLKNKIEYCLNNPDDLLRIKKYDYTLRSFKEIAQDHISLYRKLLIQP